jgi:hypothetical protein
MSLMATEDLAGEFKASSVESSGASPTCQTILDAIGNLFADGCQVEEFLFSEAVFGLFGKLPIHRGLGSKVIIPIHAWHVQDLSPMAQGDKIKFSLNHDMLIVFACGAAPELPSSWHFSRPYWDVRR